MRKLALTIFLALLACPAWATTYYIAPASAGGTDANNGLTAGAPWLTPNHSVNCGDVILAAAGTYSATNFRYGQWGTVTCPAGNNVAWLKCVTFDACKMTASGSYNPMGVTQSYWGVQGWEVTATADTNACFTAYPTNGVDIHHIIFANNVANGCYYSGFSSGPSGLAGVDYLVIVGNIAYNASQETDACVSGIDIYEPVQSDSLPGTHIYIAGNFSWANFDPSPCAGGAATDGEGILIDTPDGSQSGGVLSPYTAQIVIDNNITLSNGGRGVDVGNNSAGSVHAAVYFRHDTSWGNNSDLTQNDPYCGEMVADNALNVQEFFNLAATNTTNGCGANPLYAYFVAVGGSSNLLNNNLGWAASGSNVGIASSPGFSSGSNNLLGSNPTFANPMTPGAPNCGGASTVPACMATVIANFTPTSAAAQPFGYQTPSSAPTYDPLFPQWLCNVNLPAGLVTMGCAPLTSLPAAVTITGVTIND